MIATAVPPCGCELMPLGEGQPVHGDLGQVVVHGDSIARLVVLGSAVGDLDEQAARLVDQEREQVMGGDEMRVDREPEYSQAAVEVVLPDRRVPLTRAALEQLAAPDVVDEHVDVAVLGPDPLGQVLHLIGVEVVDCDRDAVAAEGGDELGGFLDRLGTVVVGAKRSACGCCGPCSRPSRRLRPGQRRCRDRPLASRPRPRPRDLAARLR